MQKAFIFARVCVIPVKAIILSFYYYISQWKLRSLTPSCCNYRSRHCQRQDSALGSCSP